MTENQDKVYKRVAILLDRVITLTELVIKRMEEK